MSVTGGGAHVKYHKFTSAPQVAAIAVIQSTNDEHVNRVCRRQSGRGRNPFSVQTFDWGQQQKQRLPAPRGHAGQIPAQSGDAE